MNPYASPSAASFAPGMMPSQYGDRVGLPWEQSPSLGTWWQTAKLVMGSPQTAYRMMRQYGGMGSPILYTMTGLGIGGIGQALWQVAFSVLLIMGAGQAQDAMGMFAIQLISGIIGVVFGVLIGATLGLLIAAAISHLFLMMVGGAARGFEVTLRVIGFANGSLGWLNWIPYLGPLVSFFWMMYLEVVGFTEAHEIPTQKAVWAVVLQFLICFLLPMIVVGVLIAGALAAALSQQ